MSCKYKVVGLRSHLCLHLMVMVTHTPVTCQTKGEKIMLLSTMHHDDRKPLRVLIYNELNSSVDGDYYWFACSVGSERQMANGFVLRVWQMWLAGAAALIIWLHNTHTYCTKRDSKSLFLLTLDATVRIQTTERTTHATRKHIATWQYCRACSNLTSLWFTNVTFLCSVRHLALMFRLTLIILIRTCQHVYFTELAVTTLG